MKLSSQVHTALDELRMQMLGAQVLFGFQFEAVFQERFALLPRAAIPAVAAAFALIALTIGCLLAPAAQHRLVEDGRASNRLIGVATLFSALALVAYGVTIGLDTFVVCVPYSGFTLAMCVGIAAAALAAVLWFGMGFVARFFSKGNDEVMNAVEDPPLHEKINQMLTEARVILPGAQALLGFQFLVILTNPFAELAYNVRLVHFAALAAVLIAVMLLLAPAAVHRLGFKGADAKPMLFIGSWFVTAALVPLAAGIAADMYVALTKALSNSVGLVAAIGSFGVLMGLWYALPIGIRIRTGS